jgi:hypothetical protein
MTGTPFTTGGGQASARPSPNGTSPQRATVKKEGTPVLLMVGLFALVVLAFIAAYRFVAE